MRSDVVHTRAERHNWMAHLKLRPTDARIRHAEDDVGGPPSEAQAASATRDRERSERKARRGDRLRWSREMQATSYGGSCGAEAEGPARIKR
jgi:hypothetical protein